MAKYQPPQGWSSAIVAALVLGLVVTLVVVAICVIFSSFTSATVFYFGGLVGFSVTVFMLWLFYWRQVTVKELWQGIGNLWHEFGKY